MKYLHILIMCVAMAMPASAQITGPAKSVEQVESNAEAKYLKPIPEENGKVYLLRELQLPEGTSDAEAYEKLQAWMDRCLKDDRIMQHSPVATNEPQTVQELITQTLTFSRGLLALDQTEMTYVMTASVKDGVVSLKMSHITYKYNGENRDRKMLKYTAEDHISDRVAIFKKGTKLVYGYKKFRVKTIDLMDEFEESLKQAYMIK